MTETTETAIAHGYRRDEVRYEDDPRCVARVSHLFKPASPTAADLAGAHPGVQSPPMEDVAVLAESPSVWEALPPEEER
ncbi:MAG: hypothetical protein ACK41C_10965 [Phenylobacterium sp.]|jgi:hypothetical protein|uniref:hypothetical protein n=1 Tax=Phenylobacterium sp. TaxID=1871053 RepID=UPI00391A1205